MSTRPSRGSSSLEILIALPLAALLAAMLLSTLHRSAIGANEARRLERRELAVLKTGAHLSRVMEDLDGHRFDTPPRIHAHGAITFADGEQNTVTGTARLRPSRDADAISGIRLVLERAQQVESWDGGDTIEARICPRYERHLEGADRLAGLAPDGIFGYRVLSSTQHRGCRMLRLAPEAGMLLHSSELAVPATLVPIDAEYTIYVSQSAELRHVTHSGLRNVENQPLVEGISGLSLSLSSERSIWTLRVSGRADRRTFRTAYASLLSRKGHLGFLFASRP